MADLVDQAEVATIPKPSFSQPLENDAMEGSALRMTVFYPLTIVQAREKVWDTNNKMLAALSSRCAPCKVVVNDR